jgi:hypothetical protein
MKYILPPKIELRRQDENNVEAIQTMGMVYGMRFNQVEVDEQAAERLIDLVNMPASRNHDSH